MTTASCTAGWAVSRASISPWLDAEAANLQLEIVAPEVFEATVGTPAGKVASFVEAGFGLGRVGTERVGDEAFGGRSGRSK